MRPITVNVGPLAAAVANSIVNNQTAAAPGQLQMVAGPVPAFTIVGSVANGVLSVTSIVPTGSIIAAGMTLGANGLPANAKIIGPAPGSTGNGVGSTWIVYPAPAGTLALAAARANNQIALDAPRQLLVTTTQAAPGTLTIYGTDGAGNQISETLAYNGGNLTTSQNFLTVTQVASSVAAGPVSVGTAATATSPWVMFDPYASGGYISKQTVVSGVANYTVQLSYDDPNAPGGVAPGSMGWLNDTDATFVGATTSLTGSWPFTPLWARVLLNSGAGSVRATFIQPGNLGR